MPMRLGIDISSIQYGRGISRYTSNLVRALAKEKECQLHLLGYSHGNQEVLKQFCASFENTKHVILPYPVKVMEILWNRMHKVNPEMFLGKLDVFHSWEAQPPLKDIPLVSTIHDVAMVKYPKTADTYVRKMNERSWNWLKKMQAHIVAVSHATKKDIVDLLGFDEKHVHVVYEALPSESVIELSDEEKKQVLLRFGIERPYIFFIGTQEPRKNLLRLIEAWRGIKKDVNLVIAGEAGWERISPEEGIQRLGRVTEFELAALYKQAKVLAYPSLDEGFGLPILEGFFHHVPVLTSNVSSMKEIAEDAAVLVDPFSVEDIQRGILEALEKHQHFVEKGKKRLKEFSWDKAAKQTLEVYRKAMG